MGVVTQRGSDLNRIEVVNEHHRDHEQRRGCLPDETAFTKVGREKHFHAQFWVVQEGLHKISLVVGISQCIVPVVRVLIRIRIFRFGIGIWNGIRSGLRSGICSRVFGWGRSLRLLQQTNVYTKLCKNGQAIRDSFHRIDVAYNVPHVLHTLRSRWPRTATFEFNSSLIETIHRSHISTPSIRIGEKQHAMIETRY